MLTFEEIINNYLNYVTIANDKRIMKEAVNLIESEPIILEHEFDILNEIFSYLKMDYTLKIIQDPESLEFCIAIIKQETPVIENKHDVNILLHELKHSCKNREISKMENTIINFFDASEHIEENEVLLIQNIIQYLNNNWMLKPVETIDYNNEQIMCTKIVPTYNKHLKKINKFN